VDCWWYQNWTQTGFIQMREGKPSHSN